MNENETGNFCEGCRNGCCLALPFWLVVAAVAAVIYYRPVFTAIDIAVIFALGAFVVGLVVQSVRSDIHEQDTRRAAAARFDGYTVEPELSGNDDDHERY